MKSLSVGVVVFGLVNSAGAHAIADDPYATCPAIPSALLDVQTKVASEIKEQVFEPSSELTKAKWIPLKNFYRNCVVQSNWGDVQQDDKECNGLVERFSDIQGLSDQYSKHINLLGTEENTDTYKGKEYSVVSTIWGLMGTYAFNYEDNTWVKHLSEKSRPLWGDMAISVISKNILAPIYSNKALRDAGYESAKKIVISKLELLQDKKLNSTLVNALDQAQAYLAHLKDQNYYNSEVAYLKSNPQHTWRDYDHSFPSFASFSPLQFKKAPKFKAPAAGVPEEDQGGVIGAVNMNKMDSKARAVIEFPNLVPELRKIHAWLFRRVYENKIPISDLQAKIKDMKATINAIQIAAPTKK